MWPQESVKDLKMSTSKPKAVGAVNIHFHYMPPGNVGPSRVDEEDKSLTAKFSRDLGKKPRSAKIAKRAFILS